MYVPRTIESFFITATKQFPVLLVTGARQVGKTTFLRHLAKKGRAYVTLDDPLVRTLAKEDPALFFQRFPPPLLIDEIQYAPELLPHIKMEVDRRSKAGSVLAHRFSTLSPDEGGFRIAGGPHRRGSVDGTVMAGTRGPEPGITALSSCAQRSPEQDQGGKSARAEGTLQTDLAGGLSQNCPG